MRIRNNGFTLVEMAVVVLIMGLLIGGMLIPLSIQVENAGRQETSKTLENISEALLGFAVIHRRLPCPDTDGDGIENAPCAGTEGDVPWATLGTGQRDAWNHRIRYRADDKFTDPAWIADSPDTTGGLGITNLAGTALTTADPHGPVAIIFSCGKNGLPDDGNDANGTADNPVCTNPGTPDGTYIQNIYMDDRFDDLLIWVSKNTLLNRMVAAGQWP